MPACGGKKSSRRHRLFAKWPGGGLVKKRYKLHQTQIETNMTTMTTMTTMTFMTTVTAMNQSRRGYVVTSHRGYVVTKVSIELLGHCMMTEMHMMNLMTVMTMKSTTKVAGVYPAHTQWRELALIGPWRPPPCSQNVIAPLAKPKEVTLHTPLLGTVLRPRIFKNIV